MKNPIVFGVCLAVAAMVLGGCGSGRDSLTITGIGSGGKAGSVERGGEAGEEESGNGMGDNGRGGEGGQAGAEGGGTGGVSQGGSGGVAAGGGGKAGAGGPGGAGGVGGTGGKGGSGENCTGWPTADSTCNPVKQCGCEKDKTACKVVDNQGTSTCMKLRKPQLIPGQDCSRYSSYGYLYCKEGTCADRVCWKYCDLNNPHCENEGQCVKYRIFRQEVQNVGICTHQCEPWNINSCGPGVACTPISNIGQTPGVTECQVRMTTNTGLCTDVIQCARGYGCIGGNCRKWCRVGGSDCASGQTCYRLAYTGDPSKKGLFVGNTEIGACLYPPR